ncbi:MAG: COX15/CtaA family protein, partial [Planctomycetota bacterium]|nr:COX15/CtaA family protein [Planctomycetota bacterium]
MSQIMTEAVTAKHESPNWPFRWSVVLALITFPLIWVGGLVTTTDAGMAVPDWPNTYGYNLFLYPYTTWLLGPWDIFIEHGHRLLGSLAGIVAIVLVVSTFRNTADRNLRLLSIGALVLVIAQGLLGGLRVLAIDRFLAQVHGCVGPLFFAYTGAFATLSFRSQVAPVSDPTQENSAQRNSFFSTMLLLLLFCTFLQLLLGANLRHIEESASFLFFRWLIGGHLIFAGAVAVLSIVILISEIRSQRQTQNIRRWTRIIFAFVSIQVLLGLLT